MLKRTLNRILGRLEGLTWDTSNRPLEYPPILLIGGPRTGSTLLYECLIERFSLGYITNLHHRFYLGPALLERILRVSRWPRKQQFDSRFGHISGWTGPSESWNFWYRFFSRHPQFISLSAADEAKLREVRGAVRALGSAMGRPILFKNMTCAMRLEPLLKYLPEARYIVTRREIGPAARSTLHARHKIYHDYSNWWSMEPPNFEDLKKLPPVQQVVEQHREIYKEIDRHRKGCHAAAFHDVWYEDLCGSPESVMQDIRGFLNREGIRIAERGTIPSAFPSRSQPPLDDVIEAELVRYIDATTNESGHSPRVLERGSAD